MSELSSRSGSLPVDGAQEMFPVDRRLATHLAMRRGTVLARRREFLTRQAGFSRLHVVESLAKDLS
jgi:hypothetical protein